MSEYPDPLRAALYRELARLQDEVQTQRYGRLHGAFIGGQITGLREALALVSEHLAESTAGREPS